jgi:hypothetical protein
VRDGVFGVAQGATWDAPDAVLRIDTDISPDEVQFQPGVFLVKAGPMREERARRAPTTPALAPTPVPGGAVPVESDGGLPTLPIGPEPDGGETATGNTRVILRLKGVPADRARDVLKVAILPLATTGATVSVDMQITASADNGIPGETLDLTVVEGLRQLGIDFEVFKE